MSTLLWILLGALLLILYLTALIVLGVATFRKGHGVLFFAGLILPLFWMIGALMRPTARISAAEGAKARTTLRLASAVNFNGRGRVDGSPRALEQRTAWSSDDRSD